MKKEILLVISLIIFMSIRLDAKPGDGISFNSFYSSLKPYGDWIQLDNDLVVWHPNRVDSRWRPYSIGRWSWTSDGWYWDSYEPFGWATYHYGRWYDDDSYGWIWIPDYDWGPSWVEWRYDDNYIGWAPLPPYASFNINFGIHFSIGWHSRYNCWNFVGYNRFYDRSVYNYFLDERRCQKIFERTKYRTNYFSDRDRIINGGIDRSFIERKGGYRITQREFSAINNYRDFDKNREIRNDRVTVYKPSGRDFENGRASDHFDFKRGENRSSLERDKINIPFATRGETRNFNGDRSVDRNREINPERNAINEINRNREESRRLGTNDRRTIERDRSRFNEENRNIENERNQIINKQNRSERNIPQERRVDSGNRRSSERPAAKVVRGNSRGSERSPGKSERESNKGNERKR